MKKLEDCDGDVWEGDDTVGWDCITEPGNFIPGRDILELIWGPLREYDDLSKEV